MQSAGRGLATSHIEHRLRCRLPITDFAHKTRIVGDVGMVALLAARHMAAERRRAAGATGCPRCSYAGDAPAAPGLDGRHHLELAKAQVAGPGPAPGRPLGAEDIRDLQRSPGHGAAGFTRPSFSSPSLADAPTGS